MSEIDAGHEESPVAAAGAADSLLTEQLIGAWNAEALWRPSVRQLLQAEAADAAPRHPVRMGRGGRAGRRHAHPCLPRHEPERARAAAGDRARDVAGGRSE